MLVYFVPLVGTDITWDRFYVGDSFDGFGLNNFLETIWYFFLSEF